MKKGDRVKIYQKPLTKEDFEGEAILVKHLSDESIRNVFTETWQVKFTNDSRLFIRRIRTNK